MPEGTALQKQPADGDCLFHTFSAGLHFLRKDTDGEPIHPHELRARTVAHIQRYAERCKPQWEADGKLGPSGKAVDTWEDFMAEIAKTGAYAGDAELKALCRIFDIRVALVPEAPQFPVCVFHRKASVKRTGAIFHSHQHFDFLAPADKSYPDEITQVSADSSGGFLVGGTKSTGTTFTQSSRSESVRSAWTSQDGKLSNAKPREPRSGPKEDGQTAKGKRHLSQGRSSAHSRRSKVEVGPSWTDPKNRALGCLPRPSSVCVPRAPTSEEDAQTPVELCAGNNGGGGQPKESSGLCLSGLGLGTSPLLSLPPFPFPRNPKDRGARKSKSKVTTGARQSIAGTVWSEQDEQEELSSQDLEGCEPGSRIPAPRSHRNC